MTHKSLSSVSSTETLRALRSYVERAKKVSRLVNAGYGGYIVKDAVAALDAAVVELDTLLAAPVEAPPDGPSPDWHEGYCTGYEEALRSSVEAPQGWQPIEVSQLLDAVPRFISEDRIVARPDFTMPGGEYQLIGHLARAVRAMRENDDAS